MRGRGRGRREGGGWKERVEKEGEGRWRGRGQLTHILGSAHCLANKQLNLSILLIAMQDGIECTGSTLGFWPGVLNYISKHPVVFPSMIHTYIHTYIHTHDTQDNVHVGNKFWRLDISGSELNNYF